MTSIKNAIIIKNIKCWMRMAVLEGQWMSAMYLSLDIIQHRIKNKHNLVKIIFFYSKSWYY